jgi:hypothetical protein
MLGKWQELHHEPHLQLTAGDLDAAAAHVHYSLHIETHGIQSHLLVYHACHFTAYHFGSQLLNLFIY